MRNSNFPNGLWLVVIIGFIVLYFFGLNFVPLLGPDEPRYAQVAREMYERGDWVTPTLGGVNWFEKPALLYWLQICGYKLFGVNEFAARFFSAVFGLLTVFAIFRVAKRIEKQSAKKGSYGQLTTGFAKFTAIAGATSIGMIAFSRGASFDIILTFPIALALVCFFNFELYAPHSDRDQGFQGYFVSDLGFLALFYVFIGVSLLAKGLIGAVIPFGIVFTYYFFQFRFPPRLFVFSWFWGLPLAVAVAAIWYVPMYLTHGYSFIDEFFIQHHFARYTSNKYLHPQPFYFFWWVLPLMTFPWVFWFGASFWSMGNWRSGEAQLPLDYLRHFSLAWVFFPVLFFTFSGSKLPGYILPALPGAMILVGDRLRRFSQNNENNEWLIFGLSSGTILSCFLILLFFVQGFASKETVKPLIEAANSAGYANAKVINMHNISHNLEFYAPNRLIRSEDGKLRRFEGVPEVVETINKEGGKPVLVFIPLEYVSQLTSSEVVAGNVLGDNKELAAVAVSLK